MVEDRLKVRAPLPLPDELVAELRLHKAEVLAFLQDKKSAWTSGDWRAFYEERAAIAEHDGGLPRAAAEQQVPRGLFGRMDAAQPTASFRAEAVRSLR